MTRKRKNIMYTNVVYAKKPLIFKCYCSETTKKHKYCPYCKQVQVAHRGYMGEDEFQFYKFLEGIKNAEIMQ